MRYCPQCGTVTEQANCPQDGTTTVRRVATLRGDLAAGEVIGGRYRVKGILGRGGFGTVYEAEHVTTGHGVAVKILVAQPGSEGEELARRFFKEAATTSRLSHPNTVRVFDFGQTDRGDLFLAMERLVGETLLDRLNTLRKQQQVMAEEDAVEIGVAILRSLGEAHAHGLVHRDLKPANIFLHEVAGGEAIVKVLDFGIVKELDATLTQAGKAIGTPTHMSPEQAMGKAVDGRSDLYATAVLLFECLTGALPFVAESPLAIVMMHVTEDVPSIESRIPGRVRPAVAAVVERALAKDPDQRFADAAAMRTALQRALRTPAPAAAAGMIETVVGPPPSMTPLPASSAVQAPSALEARQSPRKKLTITSDTGEQDATAVGVPAMPEEEKPSAPSIRVRLPTTPPAPPPPVPLDSAEIAFRSQPTVQLDASAAPEAASVAPEPEPEPAPAAPAADAAMDLDQEEVDAVATAEEQAAPDPATAIAPAAAPDSASGEADAASDDDAGEAPHDAFMVISGVETGESDAVAAAPLAEMEPPEPRQRRDSQRHTIPPQASPAVPERPDIGRMARERVRGFANLQPPGGASPLGRPHLRGADLASLAAGLGTRGLADRISQDLLRMTDELRRRHDAGPSSRNHQIASLHLAADLHHVVVGTRGGHIRLHPLDGLDFQPRRMAEDGQGVQVGEHDAAVVGLATLSGGRQVLAASVDGMLRLWSTRDGELIAETHLDALPTALACSYDGKLAVVGDNNGGASLVEVPSLHVRRVLHGHKEAVTSVAVEGSRRSVVTGSEDGSVRTWDPVGGGSRLTNRQHGAQIGAVAVSRDGRWVASGGWDGRLLIWSARTGEIRHDLPAHADVIAGLCFASDGAFVASASDDRSLRVWRTGDGHQQSERAGFEAGAKVVRFESDAGFAVVGTWGGEFCRVPVAV